MKRRVIAALGIMMLVLSLLGSTTTAALADEECVPGVVDTYTTQVNNRPDSGLHGPWAHDNFVRTTVVSTDCNGLYTLSIKDSGTFTPIIGAKSPMQGIILQANSFADLPIGDFSGGATVTVKSDVPPTSPGLTSDGSVSTGAWAGLLFAGNIGTLLDWGWTYSHCGETWINAKSGNSGDITGIECITVPDYEVRIWAKDCRKSSSATATVEARVKGSKWHETLLVDYTASDGQQGTLKVLPGDLKAKVTLTFAEDAGNGAVWIKVPLADKRARVCTDCQPPTTSTTATTSTSATQGTTTETTTSRAPVVQDVTNVSGKDDEDLAYTGTSGIFPFIGLGGLALLLGLVFLVVYRRRTRMNS